MPGFTGHFYSSSLNTQQSIKPTFKKEERLKSRSAIVSLFEKNQVLKKYPLKVVWLVEPIEHSFVPKIGVSVSKRNFKHAVQRNFIKRRMRESYRLNKHLLYHQLENEKVQLAAMFIYTSNKIISYDEMDQKIKVLLVRLNEAILGSVNEGSPKG